MQQFIGMDDYERMLTIDRVARELGITPTQVEKEIEAFSSDGFTPDTPQDFTAAAGVPPREPQLESEAEPIEGAPKFLEEAHRYRFTYDPSTEAAERQSNAKQAIMCPHCKAALGIPPTRPIRITCPSCMMDTTFEK